jgi:hypothetical protein
MARPVPAFATTSSTALKAEEPFGSGPVSAAMATHPVIMEDSWTTKKVKFILARPRCITWRLLAANRRWNRCGNMVAAMVVWREGGVRDTGRQRRRQEEGEQRVRSSNGVVVDSAHQQGHCTLSLDLQCYTVGCCNHHKVMRQ